MLLQMFLSPSYPPNVVSSKINFMSLHPSWSLMPFLISFHIIWLQAALLWARTTRNWISYTLLEGTVTSLSWIHASFHMLCVIMFKWCRVWFREEGICPWWTTKDGIRYISPHREETLISLILSGPYSPAQHWVKTRRGLDATNDGGLVWQITCSAMVSWEGGNLNLCW